MMTFLGKLRTIERENNSLLCIGLDVDPVRIPITLRSTANPVFEFNRRIIEATRDLVCAYKLNLAFYEALGNDGWRTIRRTLELIPLDIITIADGKRGDIGSTSAMYARTLFDDFHFDAATVNPYMGSDSVQPFLQSPNRCAFLLALTSNPGSSDLQRLSVQGMPLYERVVRTSLRWNAKKNVGFVVGATHQKELHRVRKLAPEIPFLIPGIGRQGGDLEKAVRYGCDKRGRLALINASRSVIYASGGNDFAEAARRESTLLRDAIRRYQKEFFSSST